MIQPNKVFSVKQECKLVFKRSSQVTFLELPIRFLTIGITVR